MEECGKLMLSKKGSIEQLKETICRSRAGKLTREDIMKHMKHVPKASAPVQENQLLAQGEQPPVPPVQEEVLEASGSNGHGAPGESQLVLFGRETFEINMDASEGKTSFFLDMNDDPKVTVQTGSYLDIIEEGKDGIIPVAALVKVFQGLQEVADAAANGSQVAVLLAGAVGQTLGKTELILWSVYIYI